MKSNELRIGNKLQKDNGKIFTVSRLDESIDIQVKEERGLLTLGYNLFGIPLTEERLLKCGFTKSKLEGYDVHFKYSHYLLHSGITALYNSEFSIKLDDVARGIKYLHQLQNLYFALTGEELEIRF